jgi:hypothetical protein
MPKTPGKKKNGNDPAPSDFDNPMMSSDEEDAAQPEPGQPAREIEDEEGQVPVEPPKRYMACSKAVVRLRSDLDSEELDRLSKGQVILVTHLKKQGEKTRLRYKGGWTSPLTNDGYTVLFSADNENRHYRAQEDCTVRVGFDKTSDKAGNPVLPKNKVIEVIDMKPAEAGSKTMRLQFSGGWTSDVSAKGTTSRGPWSRSDAE